MSSPPAHRDGGPPHDDDEPSSPIGRHSPGIAHAFAASDRRRLTHKLDRRILPFILAAYLFQQLDKSTLMYASVFGLVDDAHLVGKQLSWLGSVLYLAQLVAQPAAAWVLVKFPLGKVIGTAILLWGMTLCLMSRCTTFGSLCFMRFVLGAFESIIAPGCLAITQMWWGKEEQTLRVSSWNAMNGIAPIVGGIMSYYLGHIETKQLFTYQIIFLTCGFLTICLSVPVWLYLPDHPSQADFLTEKERAMLTERLQASRSHSAVTRKWRWDHVQECIYDPKTYCWVAIHSFLAVPSGGIGVFGSLIIKDFGYDKFQTILFNIPFGLVQLFAILGSAVLATRLSRKGPVIGMICCGPIFGCMLLLGVPHTGEHRTLLLFAYLIITVQSSITPLNLTWQAQNTAGETKKQFTTALMFVGACFGNVIGPLLYDPDQAPLYAFGLTSSMLMFACVLGTASITYLYLKSLNNRRRATRGKYLPLLDPQVEAPSLGGRPQAAATARNVDMTDLEDESFEYVL